LAVASVIDENAFHVVKQVQLDAATTWDGSQMKVPVTFEPTELGQKTDTLTLTTADGGTYTCVLSGKCTPPMPQGPFDIAAGSSRDISFRNCFSAPAAWSFTVDSPHFKVSTASANVGAKSDGSVGVSFNPQENAPVGPITAKLFVGCTDKPDVPAWIFYLRGNQ
jgi:hydrocephalus-inducing protein